MADDEFSSEEGKLRVESGEGHTARSLLENPLLVETFETLRNKYREALETAPIGDLEGLQGLLIMLRMVSEVEDHIREVVDTGKLANARLDEIRSIREARNG